MKVILLKSVPKVGKKNQIVEVADGYAQHALLPKKLAIPATAKAVAALEVQLANDVTERKIQHQLLDAAISAIEAESFQIHTKANDKGHLFSKIDVDDIARELMNIRRIAIDSKKMQIVGGPIKDIGTYTIKIADGEYSGSFVLQVQKQ